MDGAAPSAAGARADGGQTRAPPVPAEVTAAGQRRVRRAACRRSSAGSGARLSGNSIRHRRPAVRRRAARDRGPRRRSAPATRGCSDDPDARPSAEGTRVGAGGGTRTPTGLRLTDFKSVASTGSATPASGRSTRSAGVPGRRGRAPPETGTLGGGPAFLPHSRGPRNRRREAGRRDGEHTAGPRRRFRARRRAAGEGPRADGGVRPGAGFRGTGEVSARRPGIRPRGPARRTARAPGSGSRNRRSPDRSPCPSTRTTRRRAARSRTR